jgi:dipeptidyl aminopeptidase/acylaminoacyl peptidase
MSSENDRQPKTETFQFHIRERILIHRSRLLLSAKRQSPHPPSFSVVATTLLLTTLLSPGLRAQTSSNVFSKKRPITVADGLAMTRLEAREHAAGTSSIAHFSPDGKRFIVLLRKGNPERNTNDFSLLLYKTDEVFHTVRPDLLLKMSSSSDRDAISKVRWLDDNETLAFLGENPGEVSQVYTFDIRGRLLKKLTNHPRAVTNYDITGDSRETVFTVDPQETKTTCAEQGPSKEVVIAGHNLTDILTGEYSKWEGRQVLWQSSGHSARLVPVGAEYSINPSRISISYDGRYALILGHIRHIPSQWLAYQNVFVQQLFAANFPQGETSPLRQYLLFDTEDGSLAPLISAPMIGMDSFSWAADGKSVFLSSYLPLDIADPAERKSREQNKYLIEVKLPTREYRKVKKEDFPFDRIQNPLSVTIEQDNNTPPKLYVSNSKSQQKTLLLDLNPQFDELNFGMVRTIEWKVDGIEVLGGLYLPPDYIPGQRYPLVIQTHGFAPKVFSMDGLAEWSSGSAARPLAAKGIMVLQLFEFNNQADHDRVGSDRKLGATLQESFRNFQVLAYEGAIDFLDKMELIDRNRIGIVGFSRTACFVGYALTHSKYRFAAASLVDGISCGYFEEIAHPNGAFDTNNLNGGAAPFGEGLKLWMKNSPGFNLDHVQTPVRLVSLGNYSVVSAWEWYAGLTLQKKPVDFVLLPGAVHLGVKMSQRALTQEGIVDWFRFWLSGAEDPDPGKAGQYTRWRELRKLHEENERNPHEK